MQIKQAQGFLLDKRQPTAKITDFCKQGSGIPAWPDKVPLIVMN
jgi:hypothetical protein